MLMCMGDVLGSWYVGNVVKVSGCAVYSRRDANNINSVVKSDTSTTSSNHIRVSDGSASSANSTKAEVVVATATVVEPPVKRVEATNPCSGSAEDNVSADYAEIEEEKTEHKQKVGTLQSAADSTLSTVSSFNSSARGSTLMYNGGQDSFLDNLEPGAHNTPKFPKMASQYDHLAFNTDYEKDPNSVNDHDYEQDPDYQQQKRFDPPLPPAHLYQTLKQYPQQSGKETHYNTPERTLRPLSEKLPRVLGQPDYADAIPHSNSISTPQSRNINYTELRKSTLDPTPHYTHLDVNTKEHTRSSGLSYVTTDL